MKKAKTTSNQDSGNKLQDNFSQGHISESDLDQDNETAEKSLIEQKPLEQKVKEAIGEMKGLQDSVAKADELIRQAQSHEQRMLTEKILEQEVN